MKKPLRHVFDYILLCLFFSVSLILLIYFNGNPNYQIFVVILSSIIYSLWGYFHHKKEGSLNSKIIIEYMVYGLLGGILVVGLI